jgi:hypothetical protein
MIDSVMNRLSVKKGSELPQSKLNETLVKKIREDYEFARNEIARLQRHYSAKGLAEYYGVHVRTMEKMLSGESWSHVV